MATFLWVIASLSVQSGMYQLIEKLLAYLSVVLHVSFLTLSISVFQSILVYLFIYLFVCLFFHLLSVDPGIRVKHSGFKAQF